MPNEHIVRFTTDEVQFADLNGALQKLVGSAPGKLLRFKNAVLAREEVNKNGDELDLAGLQQVAATLPLLAIDEEHKKTVVVGYYTDAHVADGALLCDGIIFANRFPAIATGVLDGSRQLSIEADASEAECSVCGATFKRESAYCQHLKARRTGTARRKLRGLTAVGGAVTANPAGTNTGFDPNQIQIIASVHQEGTPIGESVEVQAFLDQVRAQSQARLIPAAGEEKVASAMRAAQRVMASGAVDLMTANPGGHINLSSPVLSPILFIPVEPDFVRQAASVKQVGQPTAPASVAAALPAADTNKEGPQKGKGEAEPDPKTPAGKKEGEEEGEEIKARRALEARLASIEQKLEAAIAPTPPLPVPGGIGGLAFEPERPAVPEKLQATWKRRPR